MKSGPVLAKAYVEYFSQEKKVQELQRLLAELVIQFLFFLIATDASFIGTIMIGVLGTTIPYYSKKYFNATFIAFIILFLIGQFVRQIMGVTDPSVSGICNVVVTIAVMVVMFALSNICTSVSYVVMLLQIVVE